ncbi:MAG: hypothetical protein AVDCRST_MAG93-6840 [uncultured Chloroflexia bacterium]|uniref:Uncharacterized protein n=1 Tax=uncultured Chloroflexia bacterium TaxID=1672391 RepID=A0A6J4M0Q3_9CHLR|nr:MAG: hypothetical protein AVDCRST_MAG93-6840 [uncultured Chloroflexia bacterium]
MITSSDEEIEKAGPLLQKSYEVN